MIFHKDLRSFWSELAQRDDFDVMAPILLELMEKFDVCFVLAEDRTKPFVEQRSILPALLPTNPNSRLHRQQASTESQEFEIEMKSLQTMKKTYMERKNLFEAGELSDTGKSKFIELEGNYFTKRDLIARMESKKKAWGEKLQKEKKRWPDFAKPEQKVEFERTFHFEAVPMEVISKIISQLHSYIDGKTVYRDLVFLKLSETQAKITVESSLDRFVIEIRSPSLEDGEIMLAKIKESISDVLSLFTSGVQGTNIVTEGVRSPFSDAIIPLEKFSKSVESHLTYGEDSLVPVRMLKKMAGLEETRDKVPRRQGLCSLLHCFLFFFFDPEFSFSLW